MISTATPPPTEKTKLLFLAVLPNWPVADAAPPMKPADKAAPRAKTAASSNTLLQMKSGDCDARYAKTNNPISVIAPNMAPRIMTHVVTGPMGVGSGFCGGSGGAPTCTPAPVCSTMTSLPGDHRQAACRPNRPSVRSCIMAKVALAHKSRLHARCGRNDPRCAGLSPLPHARLAEAQSTITSAAPHSFGHSAGFRSPISPIYALQLLSSRL